MKHFIPNQRAKNPIPMRQGRTPEHKIIPRKNKRGEYWQLRRAGMQLLIDLKKGGRILDTKLVCEK
jgi:hypothetical protein